MRTIAVITGTRAEFGLLRNLMHELNQTPQVNLKVIVTGAHLSHAHGETICEIVAEGFEITETVDMLLTSDSRRAVGLSMGLGVIGLTGALDRMRPDLVVVLGDRYEILAAAQSAMILGIPIAHIHGGEVTEGAVDEAIRHAITKMSHLHFTAAEDFRTRVIQLGEMPERVWNVGATGLDNIPTLDMAPRAELEEALGITFGTTLFLVTYHPVTLGLAGESSVMALLDALHQQDDETSIVFTGANADAQGSQIDKAVAAFCKDHPKRTVQVASLGYRRYLSLMTIADVVVGNSSSGIIEAPSIGVPTVNIGPRQHGRPRARSVIDCNEDTGEISNAIAAALAPNWRNLAHQHETPYGTFGAGKRIAHILTTHSLEGLLRKRFHDQ